LLVLLGTLIVAAVVISACGAAEPGPQGPAGPAGPAGPPGPEGESALDTDLSCTECHNDTSLITGKHAAWEESLHGSGEAFVRGTSASCAGCHSGGAFSERVAAGLNPGEVEVGDPNPTRQDCRTCHQIHTTYTGEDWALETTEAVSLYAVEGATFDGGEGNLCVQCHQPRRDSPVAEDGIITGISSHWGPHHGPQSSMLLGVAGAGEVGSPSAHYTMVEDTCVACHMGEGASHTFEPSVTACQACHADAENFDINGVQTEVQGMLDELGEQLVALGVLTENGPDGHPTDQVIADGAPENVGIALYNWIYVAHEDKSLGVHNPAYTKALLQAGLDALAGE
jgi:cytochrome c551/c552